MELAFWNCFLCLLFHVEVLGDLVDRKWYLDVEPQMHFLVLSRDFIGIFEMQFMHLLTTPYFGDRKKSSGHLILENIPVVWYPLFPLFPPITII